MIMALRHEYSARLLFLSRYQPCLYFDSLRILKTDFALPLPPQEPEEPHETPLTELPGAELTVELGAVVGDILGDTLGELLGDTLGDPAELIAGLLDLTLTSRKRLADAACASVLICCTDTC